MQNSIVAHKENERTVEPLVSIILLDWSVREWFQALEWLPNQDVPRTKYELIWVELYDRVVPEAMEVADVVITCGQQGMYHKHVGYNVGLLHARGKVVTVCDSDAVFPRDFISSILATFDLEQTSDPRSLVLMHHEWRTTDTYPGHLSSLEDVKNRAWLELWPNAGACMSVTKRDAVRFGGFDEHPSFRGFLCGPYDLGWRLVNAGIPEVWHDEEIALWHFAHPNPPGSWNQKFSWKLWREMAYPHIDHHALEAVEALSTGRLLPLQENPAIHEARMSVRQIGSKLEAKYLQLTGPGGFSRRERLVLRGALILEPFKLKQRFSKLKYRLSNPKSEYKKIIWEYRRIRAGVSVRLLTRLQKLIGPKKYASLKARWRSLKS